MASIYGLGERVGEAAWPERIYLSALDLRLVHRLCKTRPLVVSNQKNKFKKIKNKITKIKKKVVKIELYTFCLH